MTDKTMLELVKDVVTVVSSAVSTVAILVGGFLAWRRWGKEVPQAPRGDLSHYVAHRLLTNSHRLIHVALTIKNTGKVTLRPIEAYTLVQQVVPLRGGFAKKLLKGKDPLGITKTEFDWPVIDRRDYPVKDDELRIDSGETERLNCEFVIPASVQTIIAYSMVSMDAEDDDLGWDVTTFHELDSPLL